MQKELRRTLDEYGIRLMSWYPLGHGDKSLLNEPVFAKLGEKYCKSPAQIILRWHTQMGFVVILGSRNTDHICDNLNITDFRLTEEEMDEIAKLNKNERYYHRTDEQLVSFAAWRPEFESEQSYYKFNQDGTSVHHIEDGGGAMDVKGTWKKTDEGTCQYEDEQGMSFEIWYVVSEDSLYVEWYSENPDDPYYSICYAYRRQ